MRQTTKERQLRLFHTAVTAQFTISAALIIFWSLYETGLHWWAVFSFSAQGFVIVFLGVLIYGFAVFRGTVGERIEAEHPLTGSICYRLFYLVLPIIGGIAVGIEYFEAEGLLEGVRGLALGTVLTAYVVWLFVDPVAGVIESGLPESRRLRGVRLAQERARREARQRRKEIVLERIRAERKALLDGLEPVLARRTEDLTALLEASAYNPEYGAEDGASIGLEIWQAGGMDTMRELYESVKRSLAARRSERLLYTLDYWWDGVGDWRREGAATVTA